MLCQLIWSMFQSLLTHFKDPQGCVCLLKRCTMCQFGRKIKSDLVKVIHTGVIYHVFWDAETEKLILRHDVVLQLHLTHMLLFVSRPMLWLFWHWHSQQPDLKVTENTYGQPPMLWREQTNRDDCCYCLKMSTTTQRHSGKEGKKHTSVTWEKQRSTGKGWNLLRATSQKVCLVDAQTSHTHQNHVFTVNGARVPLRWGSCCFM